MPTRLTPAQRRRRAENRRYRTKHRAELLIKRRAYRATHRKQINQAWRKWARTHPEKMALYRKKKNARRRRLRREARLAAHKAP